jgi:Holliday junction resolvasome RuvABC ATP-dependent DNA helicase subunit
MYTPQPRRPCGEKNSTGDLHGGALLDPNLTRELTTDCEEENRDGEKMSIETTIVSAIAKIGELQDVQRLMERNEGYFRPTTYPDPDGPTGATCQVHIAERFSGVRVLRLQALSAYLISDAEFSYLNEWADNKNISAMFARVQFRGHSMGGDSEFKTMVECNLPLHGLREEVLVEVINDMLSLWQQAVQFVEQVNKRLAREKSVREKAEMREAWLREKYGEEELEKQAAVAEEKAKELSLVLAELDSLTGLNAVKTMVRGLIASQKMAEKRAAVGLPAVQSSPHLVFNGNPGTGKTTVARLVGRIYKSLGLLSKGHVVEVGRADLVGAYIGHTAIRTKQYCEKALGGVLFIDEAYSLNVDGRDYGQEVIETILTFMEEHRGKFVVIVAGYPKEMEKFLDSNPGLRSRFDTAIQFDDYSLQELMEIFDSLLLENKYEITSGARQLVIRHLADLRERQVSGNARLVRNVFQQLIAQHAMSLSGLESLTAEQLSRITMLAVPDAWGVNIAVSLDDLPPLVVGE